MTRSLRAGGAIAACVVLVTVLSACSGSGSTTCQQYGDTALTARGKLLTDLLRAHDLDTADPGNVLGVTNAVNAFCATYGAAARDNLDRSIDEAVDWSSPSW